MEIIYFYLFVYGRRSSCL